MRCFKALCTTRPDRQAAEIHIRYDRCGRLFPSIICVAATDILVVRPEAKTVGGRSLT